MPERLDRRWEMWIRQVIFGPCIWKLTPVIGMAAYLWRRLMWRTTFIGITGSLGKTTCKELLARILKDQAPTCWTIGNQNGPGLAAMNILRVRPWHHYAVIEVAGAAPGMMQWIAPKVRPDVSVVLAMRRTHSTEFATLDEHAREKTYLLQATSGRGTVALFADDERVAGMAGCVTQQVTRFGVSPCCDLMADNVSARWPERLTFDVHCDGETRRVRTRLVGEHWLAAVLGALAVARSLGIPLDSAIRSVAAVDPFRGRLQPVRLPNGAIVLRDDYNAAVDSADAAFKVMRQAQARRRVLVFSDLSDFGGNRKKRLRYVGAEVPHIADLAVFVGESSDYGIRCAVEAGFSADNAFGFATLPEVAEFLKRELRKDDLVLLKGRTTDHIGRLFFAQFGTVACWKEHCPKTMLCDECWELGTSAKESQRVSVVPPDQSSQC